MYSRKSKTYQKGPCSHAHQTFGDLNKESWSCLQNSPPSSNPHPFATPLFVSFYIKRLVEPKHSLLTLRDQGNGCQHP